MLLSSEPCKLVKYAFDLGALALAYRDSGVKVYAFDYVLTVIN